MIIGEAPGEEEDMKGLPFVGKSGKLLRGVLGDKQEEVYIANIVKCRPPDNRNPTKDEIEACIPYLYEQIKAVDPDIIITLGRVPFEALMGRKTAYSMKKLINNSPYYYNGDELYAMYHPSYILRARSNEEEWSKRLKEVIE